MIHIKYTPLNLEEKSFNKNTKLSKVSSEYTYEDGMLYVCPECAHEWAIQTEPEIEENQYVVKDSNGNILHDGDSITVIKDLKVKGTSLVVKIEQK